jgi:hypothetical protein
MVEDVKRTKNISSDVVRATRSRLSEMPEEVEARPKLARACKAEKDRQALQQRTS